MSWGLVVGAVVAAGSAYMQGEAAEDAAGAQQDGNNAAIAEDRRQYDQTREDMLPWMQAGGWALDQQQAFLQGDRSGFEKDAAYTWARDQGLAGLASGHAAGGNLWGGGADADRMAFNQGIAYQHAGD